jgi:hypothetical protein
MKLIKISPALRHKVVAEMSTPTVSWQYRINVGKTLFVELRNNDGERYQLVADVAQWRDVIKRLGVAEEQSEKGS